MLLQDLLKIIAREQTILVRYHLTHLYTGELEEWEDAETFMNWEVVRVYVGVFGTLTIDVENEKVRR